MKSQPGIQRAWSQVWPLAADIVSAFQRHSVPMLARQAAFSLLYALPAMIALLLALSSLADWLTNAGLSSALLDEIEERAPEEFQELLDSIVAYAIAEQSGSTAAIGTIVALVITLWTGSGGTNALIFACNRVFDVADHRSWLVRRLLALVLTLAGGTLVIVAFLLFLLGERVGDWIIERWGRGSTVIDSLLTSPLGPAMLIFAAITLLYWLAPDVPRSIQWLLPGATLATLSTVLAFAAFDLVVGLIDPGSAFGAAGSVLVLLWLLDLVSMIVVSGATINAVLSERYDPRLVAWLEDHPERHLPPGESG